MRSIYKSVLVLLLFALAGCASAPAPTTYYLLRGEPTNETREVSSTTTRVGLGRILVSPYLLSSTGIMVETGKGEVNPAGQHQWAESLDAGLRWYLRREIGRQLGTDLGGSLTDRRTWDYAIDVSLSRLHGTMEGDALIEAEFTVASTDSTGNISETRFSKSTPLQEEGYAGLVDAEKRLLAELAGLIASALQEQIDSRTSMDSAPE